MYQQHKVRYFMIWQPVTSYETRVTSYRNDEKHALGRDYRPTEASLSRLNRLSRDYHLTTIIRLNRLAVFIDNKREN